MSVSPVVITLQHTPHLEYCEKIAIARRENAVAYGYLPHNGAPVNYQEALRLDRIGLPGECACKLYLNPVKWNAFRSGPPRSDIADLEDWIDVKARTRNWHDLIVQFDDDPSWAYPLALVHDLPRVHLIGWCWGAEAMHHRFKADPAGGRPAYFIPQTDPVLHDMSELYREVRRRQEHIA
jgi:hypothetical protein